jgi:hypothetical protein
MGTLTTTTHHAEGLVDPKVGYKKTVTALVLDTPKHVDSEYINLKIGYGSSLYQLFSKRDFLIHKMWLKLAKIGNN